MVPFIFSFFAISGWGIDLDYCDIEWFALEMNRDLFKKIRDTKGIFHEKIGLIKDRNDMDLTKAEEVFPQ